MRPANGVLAIATLLAAFAAQGCAHSPQWADSQPDWQADGFRETVESLKADSLQWEAEREAREWREARARFNFDDNAPGWIAWRDSVMEADFLKGAHQ